MINNENEDKGHHADETGEIAGAFAHADQKGDIIAAMVKERVSGFSPLLRQQLELKAKREPLMYDQSRIDQIVQEFEASFADVQATIRYRVMSKVTAYVQNEILRVMEDAVNDFSRVLERPVQNPGWERLATADNDEPPRSSADTTPPELEKQDLNRTSHSQGTAEELLPEAERGVYEGMVELQIESTQALRTLVKFIDTLRRNSEFRLLRIVGNQHEGVGIWLGLRAPVDLKEALLGMEGVSQVDAVALPDRKGEEPLLKVRLEEPGVSGDSQ